MKLTILRNLGRGLPDYTEGQTVDVDDHEAQELLEKGLAEPADPKAKPTKADQAGK